MEKKIENTKVKSIQDIVKKLREYIPDVMKICDFTKAQVMKACKLNEVSFANAVFFTSDELYTLNKRSTKLKLKNLDPIRFLADKKRAEVDG